MVNVFITMSMKFIDFQILSKLFECGSFMCEHGSFILIYKWQACMGLAFDPGLFGDKIKLVINRLVTYV